VGSGGDLDGVIFVEFRVEKVAEPIQWERTPFRQGIGDLVLMVLDRFPWTLTPIAENPARTSDREY
jgi:hypothetical protein